MSNIDSHISDQDLVLRADGELSTRNTERVDAHLAQCWACRTRKQELERGVVAFVHAYKELGGAQIPPADGPRALLRAQLAQTTATSHSTNGRMILAIAAGVLVILGLASERWWIGRQSVYAAVTVPNPRLTPGATVLLSRHELCGSATSKNKSVPVALQRAVFQEYGMSKAEPRAYEVDYLITPALGGADDIHNLWPQSYQDAVWNAQVKDDLEDHLRDMVCQGSLDLATAQREIAVNWIAAYKKYFHTDVPVKAR